MSLRSIDVTTDTFALLWSRRLPGEHSEDGIIRRLAGTREAAFERAPKAEGTAAVAAPTISLADRPKSKKWTDLFVWALEKLGGEPHLSEIYRVSREGRRSLGYETTLHHDDSARECLESHCRDSKKWRGKADLFWMPHGKGTGIWALR